jgi:hypothetical protein
MEEFPRPLFETPDTHTPETGSKRRKKSKIRLPRLASVESAGDKDKGKEDKSRASDTRESSTPEPGIIEQEKAKYARKRTAEKAAKSERAAQKAQEQTETSPEPAAEVIQAAPAQPEKAAPEKEKAESAKDYEQLPSHTLAPSEFSGGEVIIHLKGDGPVEEHVIPLHAPAETNATPATAASVEAKPVTAAQPRPTLIRGNPVVFQRQPEQQHQTREQPMSQPPEPVPGRSTPEHQTSSQPESAHRTAVAPESARLAQPESSPEPVAQVEAPRQTPEYAEQTVAAVQPVHETAVPPIPPLLPRFPRANPSEALVSPKALEAAAYQAQRDGVRRGLVTGLLAGGLYEHFKHRRREKRKDKTMQERVKKLERARESYTFTSGEQLKKQDRTEHQLRQVEQKLGAQTAAVAAAAQRSEAQPAMQIRTEQSREAAGEPQTARTEQTERAPTALRAERAFIAATAVHPEQATAALTQLSPAEQQAVAQGAEGHIAVPEGHILNTEGWVITEIDKVTGKVVEKPTFEYGHEFYRERAQEGTPAAQRIAATGEVALVAAALSQTQSTQQRSAKAPKREQHGTSAAVSIGASSGSASVGSPSVSVAGSSGSSSIPSASTQGSPSKNKPLPGDSTAQSVGGSGLSNASQPLWPLLIALGVIIFLIVLLS